MEHVDLEMEPKYVAKRLKEYVSEIILSLINNYSPVHQIFLESVVILVLFNGRSLDFLSLISALCVEALRPLLKNKSLFVGLSGISLC